MAWRTPLLPSFLSTVLLALAGMLATPPGRAVAGDAPGKAPARGERTWAHPVERYPTSVRRWFIDLPAALRYSEVRVRRGDDARWAQPGWDDRSWPTTGFWELRARAGIDWVRVRVRMGERAEQGLPAGIMISSVRAYEIYWDGVKLGNSGAPGPTWAEEQPGRVDEWFSIPAALCGPGEHLVAFRTSSYRCGFPAATSGFRMLIDDPAVLRSKVLREALLPTLAAGALFMTAAASLIMWLGAARRATLLLLGGVCLSGAVMQALQAVRWFFSYPADWHYPVLTVMTALVAVQAVLTVGFVLVHFAVPRRRWLLGGLVPAFLMVSWLSPERQNLEGVWLLGMGMGVSLACAGWAAWRRRRGAWPVVVGVALSSGLLALEAEDYRASFFLKFLPVLLGLMASVAVQLHDERRRARSVELTAARLETELLKKNLQPHFLLNSLTALAEVVEQDPRGAGRLIEDLAEEFRTVSRVSAEKRIPLAEEIELCRAHLRVMSVRLARPWTLEVTDPVEGIEVPPAIFLTLIENGFTHQRAPEGAAIFRLWVRRTADGGLTLAFFSPGTVQTEAKRPAGGTGLRYVQARLEESFSGRWTLRSEPVEGGWQTTVEIAGTTKGRRRDA